MKYNKKILWLPMHDIIMCVEKGINVYALFYIHVYTLWIDSYKRDQGVHGACLCWGLQDMHKLKLKPE